MSVKISLPLALALLAHAPAQAEMGKGTAQDPVTRAYTDHVYKDWIEGVKRDPQTGNYIITYKDSSGFFNEILFEPADKIDPVVRSTFRHAPQSDLVRYEYTLANGAASQQRIRMLVSQVSSVSAGPGSPKDWEGYVVPTFANADLRLSWAYEGDGHLGGLAPGRSIGDFQIESVDLPGIAVMQVEGAARHVTWLGDATEPESAVGMTVLDLEKQDFVPVYVAVPRITVTSPFEPGTVLAALQTHITNDWIPTKLIEPVFASQIDRLLAAARNAAERGDDERLRDHLKELRRVVKKAHPGADTGDEGYEKKKGRDNRPIGELAARVLDFDIEYVLKRLERGKGV